MCVGLEDHNARDCKPQRDVDLHGWTWGVDGRGARLRRGRLAAQAWMPRARCR